MHVLKQLCLSALASAAFLAPMSAATVAEKMKAHEVELADLVARPHAFANMRVTFRATFIETAGIFSSYHTRFSSAQYMNFAVWDDDAEIWKPKERAKAVLSLYFPKKHEGAPALSGMKKYTVVKVTGEVVSHFRKAPWIKCHSVERVKNAGAFTDNAIYHLEQGVALESEQRHVLADEHFAAALTDRLPPRSRVVVQKMQADNLIDGKSYERAVEVLTDAINSIEQNTKIPQTALADLLYLRAKALSEHGERQRVEEEDEEALQVVQAQFEQAADDAARSIKLRPSDGDTYAVLGISLAGLERFDEAKRQCERAIRLRPDNAEVRWYLGRILDLQESYDEAIDVLKQAIDLAPKDYRLHKAIGQSYFHRSNLGGAGAGVDLQTALREYDIAIRLNASDADLHYWSGRIIEVATEREQKIRIGPQKTVDATFDMAIERFQNCLSVDEKYTEAHIRLGERLRAKEQHDAATGHYKRAIELEPARYGLYDLLGKYYWELEKREEALAVYQAFNERQAEHIDTLYALGRLCYELGKFEQAVEWHLQLLKLVPDHALGNADLTECYFNLGDHREVIKHADIALSNLADPAQVTRTHRFKGLTLAATDKQQEVVENLNKAVEGATDPRLPIALGWALTVYKQPKAKKGEEPPPAIDTSGTRIQALANQALALDAESVAAKELLGWGKYLDGDFAGAEKVFFGLTANDQPIIAYRQGISLYRQGPTRYSQAKALLDVGYNKVRSRSVLHKDIRTDARAALRVIRDHFTKVERDKRDAARAAARAKEAADRKAREEARKKAIEDKKKAEAARKKAEAEAKAKDKN